MKKIIAYFFILCMFFLFFPKVSYALEFNFPVLIAHAGGAYNERKYLNSYEAVQKSIERGFMFIELDLLETADGDLVAAHDWKSFHNLTGFSGQTEPISVHKIKQRKILDNQTILTSKEINEIFTKHKNLILVTDKIQNIDLIKEKFSSFLNRLIVEVFSVEKYKEAKEKGILFPAFCVWDSKERYNLASNNGITMITLMGNNVNNHLEWFKKNPGIVALAFSIKGDQKANSISEIKNYAPYIRGWYTDFLKPKDFE